MCIRDSINAEYGDPGAAAMEGEPDTSMAAQVLSLPNGGKGWCGRFIRGVEPEDFHVLNSEPGKRLAFICDEALLGRCHGLTPAEAMVEIGFGLDWMEARLSDGTQHKLVLFPASAAVAATWDNMIELVGEHYGHEVRARLDPFLPCLLYTSPSPRDRTRSRMPSSA
eukprot:TRINITY_DN10074_c0_g1_i1.p1 TRINITY_DN10074_c0_g1~~TRINITY_DN10074_c0_g1_i1.p1  ORF type:complete len:167 (+),score=42.89 TRINITY_DN10074_c0_g1_i1:79-579(+)